MRASSTSRPSSRTLDRIVAFMGAARSAWARRRLVGEMAAFDDHMLKDIGLTRADLYASLAVPAYEDPTLRLAAWAHEARANRRACALEQRRWAAMVGEADRLGAADLKAA